MTRRTRPATLLATGLTAVLAALALPAAAAADSPPLPAFTMTPNPATVGQDVLFVDRSGDADGRITLREWDFTGNGTFEPVTRARARRKFARPRCVVVRLRVTDDAGNVSQLNRMLTVRAPRATTPVCPPAPPAPPPVIAGDPPPAPNNAPSATFSYAPQAPLIGQAVELTSTATDSDGSITGQDWDLDADGEFGDATGPTAQASFATPGLHGVSLRVTDDRGVIVVGTATVTVVDPAAQPPVTPPSPLPPPPPDSDVANERVRAPAAMIDAAVRLRVRVGSARARIEILSVDAPANARITIRCRGRSCPAASTTARVGSKERLVRFRRLENRIVRAGTVLQVLVTRSGSIGRYVSFTIRGRRAAPLRRNRCMRPGGTRPIRCTGR